MGLRPVGTGSYVPDEIVPNSFFENKDFWNYDHLGRRVSEEPTRWTSAEIVRRSGIFERRKARSDEQPSDMAYIACQRALEMARISPLDLVGIIAGTVTEPRDFPNICNITQERLGARNVKYAFPVNNACASFSTAVTVAEGLSRLTPGYYLAFASEKLTSMLSYQDINDILFGDGAGAVVFAPGRDGLGVVATSSGSDPFHGKLNYITRDPMRMLRMPKGGEVLKLAIRSMIEATADLKRQARWKKVDIVIPHQANKRIIDGVRERIAEEGTEVYENIARYANMSGATCPVALDEAVRAGKISLTEDGTGKKVAIVAFGSGLVTSGIAVQF